MILTNDKKKKATSIRFFVQKKLFLYKLSENIKRNSEKRQNKLIKTIAVIRDNYQPNSFQTINNKKIPSILYRHSYFSIDRRQNIEGDNRSLIILHLYSRQINILDSDMHLFQLQS